MKFQAPKGTRDFYPEDMAIRNWIEERWRAVSLRNGFVEYDGPVFEYLDLYRVKSGEEIVSQLFHFEDRGGRELAIRPEMTPTLARMVAARAHALPKPIKWFSVPRMCRAERPQRGRLREFFQWNIDVLGEDGEIADAEAIFVLVDFLREVGLSPETAEVKINSRAIVAAILRQAAIPAGRLDAVYAVLDKRDKLSPEAFNESIREIGLDDAQREMLLRMGEAKGRDGLSDIESILRGDEEGLASCRSLRTVLDLLATMGVADYCRYDMGVVRGLAYYTGTVFEAFGKGGLRRAICGGGRYDRLLSDLGGPPMGGVGFATSDVVIQDLLAELNLLPATKEHIDFFVIDADAQLFPIAIDVTAKLRARNVSAVFSYARQGVGKQFRQAAGRKARRVVIIEPGEHAGRTVAVKDMESGVQANVAIEKLLDDPWQPLQPP